MAMHGKAARTVLMGILVGAVSVALANPAPVAEKDGVFQATVGNLKAAWNPAAGTVDVQLGDQRLAGPGQAYLLTGRGAEVAVAALGADGPRTLDGRGCLVLVAQVSGNPDAVGLAAAPVSALCEVATLPLARLGLPAPVHAAFRADANTFFGPIHGALSLADAAGGMLFLTPNAGRPALLCASTSATAAEAVRPVVWDEAETCLAGQLGVPEKSRVELRLLTPPEPQLWRLAGIELAEADRAAGVRTDSMQTGPWLRVEFESPAARTVSWRLRFAAQPPVPPPAGPVALTAAALSPRHVRLQCSGAAGDLLIRRDDGVSFLALGGMAEDRSALPGRETAYSVLPLSWSAVPPAPLASATVRTPELPPLPPLPTVYASDLNAIKAVSGWNGDPRRDLSIEDNPLRIRGETFAKGIGTHAVSEIIYRVLSNYRRFVAVVGVDDEKNDQPAGSVTFAVFADDRKLLETPVLTPRDERHPINIEIPAGTARLRLVVGDGGNGIGCDHANWANAGFITEGEPRPDELTQDWLLPGFTPLFNGKDLDGWDGDPRFWSVQEGAIQGRTTADNPLPQATFLVWRGGAVRNFMLKCRVRLTAGSSAVQYRSRDLGNWTVAGLQAAVDNAPGKAGALSDAGGRGTLAEVGAIVRIAADGSRQRTGSVGDAEAMQGAGYYRAEDWNDCTIIARGSHLVHIVNGFTVTEVSDLSPAAAGEGVLALQLGAGAAVAVAFKDIQIRHLAAEYGEPVALFNGTSLDGWAPMSDALKDTFGVRDGVITNTGKPAGYLRTEADHTNYVLRLQLRHVTEGNSGVLLRMVGPDKVWPRSIEAQGQIRSLGDIWNIDQFPLKTDPSRTNGRHTRKLHPTNERPRGEWNQYEITLDGGDLEIRVNDLLQNAGSEAWETPGKICLQSEGAQMEFRSITLVPIVRTSAAAGAK